MNERDPRKLAPHEALDCYLQEARDGASDAWLAERADVSIRQVRLWKAERHIESPGTGEPSALQGLARDYLPHQHPVASQLDWDSPRFVLREPLDYTLYSRACATLRHERFTVIQISRATGTRVEDVELALELWQRHLDRRGVHCEGCDALVDARFGPFCSKACHDRILGI